MKEKKTNKLAVILAIVGVIFVIVVAIGVFGYIYVNKKYNGDDVWLYVPKDINENALQDSLESNLGADTGGRVYFLWDLMDGKLNKACGAYKIEKGESIIDIANKLRHGTQTPIKVVFNNVRTIEQLAQRISAQMNWSDTDFLMACDSILPMHGFKKTEFSAAFFPDTYEFYWTTRVDKVVSRLLEYRNNYWNEERRAKAKSMGLSPVKVATLASIVEEETNKADERGKVARLYLNRLDRGMKLQADPTVKFAVGDFSLRRITNKHLEIKSPYNTYQVIGLPPGPIRIPSKSTLDAVLNAPKHNYIYMCAKDDFSGYHNFATDYNTHLQNARRYQAELNKRKIYK